MVKMNVVFKTETVNEKYIKSIKLLERRFPDAKCVKLGKSAYGDTLALCVGRGARKVLHIASSDGTALVSQLRLCEKLLLADRAGITVSGVNARELFDSVTVVICALSSGDYFTESNILKSCEKVGFSHLSYFCEGDSEVRFYGAGVTREKAILTGRAFAAVGDAVLSVGESDSSISSLFCEKFDKPSFAVLAPTLFCDGKLTEPDSNAMRIMLASLMW